MKTSILINLFQEYNRSRIIKTGTVKIYKGKVRLRKVLEYISHLIICLNKGI
jgi:hypothetical protein